MGLFSSRTVHHVGTQVQRLIEDPATIRNPLSDSIAETVFSKVDLVDNILETGIHSMPVRINSYYGLAKKSFPSRLPGAETVFDDRFYNTAQNYLRGIHGNSVSMIYVRFGLMNCFHDAWDTLIETCEFDPVTGVAKRFNTEKEEFVVQSITVILPVGVKETLSNWEFDKWNSQVPQSSLGYFTTNNGVVRAYSQANLEVADSSLKVRLNGVLKTKATTPPPTNGTVMPWSEVQVEPKEDKPKTEFIPINRFMDTKQYYMAVFSVNGPNNVRITKYWTYEFATGVAELDNVLQQNIPNMKFGQFYPNVHYRFNKASIEDTDRYYTRLCKHLSMDYKKVREKINQNPDVTDVSTATFTFGLNADTTDKLEAAYICDFFSKVNALQGITSVNDYLVSRNPSYIGPGISESRQAILLNDDKLKAALTFEYINETFEGVKDRYPIGTGGCGKGEHARPYSYTDVDGNVVQAMYNIPFRWYEKQVSTNIVKHVKVFSLAMVYTIDGEYLNTVGDAAEEICLIPLDKSIVDDYNYNLKNEILNRGMYFVFNSHVIQKLKWYQSGIFKVIIQVVAIVLMVYGFYEFGLEALSILEASGALALWNFVSVSLLKTVLVSFAFKTFISAVGEDLGFLIALVATVVGLSGKGFASLTPGEILKAASGMFKGINDLMAEKFQQLQEEYENFTNLQKEKNDELKAAEDLLKVEYSPITPILLGESPTDFLYRTLVFGTSGLTELNDVDSYVERALQIPNTSLLT